MFLRRFSCYSRSLTFVNKVYVYTLASINKVRPCRELNGLVLFSIRRPSPVLKFCFYLVSIHYTQYRNADKIVTLVL